MFLLNPLDALRITDDIRQNWKIHEQKLELYFTVTTPQDKRLTYATKTSLLLSLTGDIINVFSNFPFNESESSERHGTIVQKFDSYSAAQLKEVVEHHIS